MVKTGPLVTTENLGRTFGAGPTQVSAISDVDVEIHSGEFTVILGPSGSGKSTLLNLLGGMDSASTGSVRVGNLTLESLTERELTRYRRERVGFVFQFYNLVPSLTALENVSLAAALVMPSKEADARAVEALTDVGLEHRLNQFPRQLSGGEMQRVAIARARAKRPQLLLCDEPSGALDSQTGLLVLSQLQATAHETDTAVVVVTHEHSMAEAADRLIRLHDGRVVEYRRNPRPVSIRQDAALA